MRYLFYLLLPLLLLANRGDAKLPNDGDLTLVDSAEVNVLAISQSDVLIDTMWPSYPTKLSNGDTIYEKSDSVKWVEIMSISAKNDSLQFQGANQRVMFSPTSFGLKKGEGEYRNSLVLINSYHHGISDNISVGGGIMPLIIFNLAWVDVKATLHLNKSLHLGIGGILGGGFGYDSPENQDYNEWLGQVLLGGFGSVAVGSKDNFVNFFTAPIFSMTSDESNAEFLYGVGGVVRLRKKLSFFCDGVNFGTGSTDWVITSGLKFRLKRNNSIDAGIMVFTGGIPIPLPVIAYSKRFE